MTYLVTFTAEIDAQIEATSPEEAKARAMEICHDGNGAEYRDFSKFSSVYVSEVAHLVDEKGNEV